jgi:hypothetical protein
LWAPPKGEDEENLTRPIRAAAIACKLAIISKLLKTKQRSNERRISAGGIRDGQATAPGAACK